MATGGGIWVAAWGPWCGRRGRSGGNQGSPWIEQVGNFEGQLRAIDQMPDLLLVNSGSLGGRFGSLFWGI